MALDLKPLFREADVKAERSVAIIRILIAIALAAVFLLTIAGTPPAETASGPAGSSGAIISQPLLAILTIAAYLGLGLVSLRLILVGGYRHWMAWPFATLDAAFALGIDQLIGQQGNTAVEQFGAVAFGQDTEIG